MSVFAKSNFNAAVYSKFRPTYPSQLFEYIFNYHDRRNQNARWERAVDIGCGTGQAASHLRGRFNQVLCVDPSAGMLQNAREYLTQVPSATTTELDPVTGASSDADAFMNIDTQFSFIQGSAEDLKLALPEDGTVDLMIAAQACHWFNWSKVWPETRRVLRKNGTAAFWVYSEVRFPCFPNLNPLITAYAQGKDPHSSSSVGAYFQRPGRTILERMLVDVPSPAEVLTDQRLSKPSDLDSVGLNDFTRVYFSGPHPIPSPSHDLNSHPDSSSEIHPVLMRTRWSWIDFLGYLRTWSALHSYHERFPEDLSREEDIRFLEQDLKDLDSASGIGGQNDDISIRGGDIAVRFWKDLRTNALEGLDYPKGDTNKGEGDGVRNNDVPALEYDRGVGLFDKISIEWPLALLLVRRVG